MTTQSTLFSGLRLLVVEDELAIALELKSYLGRHGCEIAGPVGRLNQAMEAARSEKLDGAILDMNLHGELVYPVAQILRERNIPFLFVTGYDSPPSGEEFRGTPKIEKPFDLNQLSAAIQRLFKPCPG